MADQKREVLDRLQERREKHEGRGRIYRFFWVIGGVIVLLVGIALLILPGPGIVFIIIGLGMISFEIDWVERLLERGIEEGFDLKENLENASPGVQAAAGIASLLALAGVVWLTYTVAF